MIAQDNAMLEKAFDILNRVYFGSALPKVMITIQSRPKAYGYITTHEVWRDDAASYYEINISAEHLNRPIENVLATLQHEMVHLYCMVNGIADTSKSGRYHNKLFKAEAEKRGLIIQYAPYIGYSQTQPSTEFIAVLKDNGLMGLGIDHHRDDSLPPSPSTGGQTGKRKSSTRKYICPSCGMSVRATREVNILCGDCMCTMEVEQA